jgi:hypothetical protein
MTLKQLISRNGWLNIEATLLNEYPHVQSDIASYEEVYQTLLLLPQANTDLQICLEQVKDEWEQGTAVEVTGRKKTPHIADAQLNLPYSLHFTPWAEWLGMPIAPKFFSIFSETEIVAHCLVEMTRNGFNEATIQEQAQDLCNVMDSMSAEDDTSLTLNWEELIKQLNTKEK